MRARRSATSESQRMHFDAKGQGRLAIDVESYYRRYGPMVLRRCRALLRDEETALDAMQDVFVQLLRHQGRLRDDAPSSLLFRMATHVCLNRLRTSGRRASDDNDALLMQIAGVSDGESRTEARTVLQRLFARHTESMRVVAVLHWLDGMTLEEVAVEVGMSVSGIRKRLRQLREQMQREAEAS